MKIKIIKIAVQIILLVVIVFLAYALYAGIQAPIEFVKEKDNRYRVTVQELINVRKAQIAYKKEKGKFTANFDTLISFVKNDFITEIKREGNVPDSIYLKTKSRIEAEKMALELGIISRDTVKVSTLDSLFKKYDINKLGMVPYSNERFEMDIATVDAGGLTLHVFEAKIHNNVLLNGLERGLILNLSDDQTRQNRDIENEARKRYPGLKVGSLLENNNNEGNWSKEYELKK